MEGPSFISATLVDFELERPWEKDRVRSRIQVGTGASWSDAHSWNWCVAEWALLFQGICTQRQQGWLELFVLECNRRGVLTLLADFSWKVATNSILPSWWRVCVIPCPLSM